MHESVAAAVFAMLLSTFLSACAEDDPPAASAGAMLAGPYAGTFPLTAETRTRLPVASDAVGSSDAVRFYWYAHEAAGKNVVFEVRAESTPALAPGSVIHRAEEQIGEDQIQGMTTFVPRDLNRGGARRVEGHARWVQGLYSVRLFVDDGELATALFEVR